MLWISQRTWLPGKNYNHKNTLLHLFLTRRVDHVAIWHGGHAKCGPPSHLMWPTKACKVDDCLNAHTGTCGNCFVPSHTECIFRAQLSDSDSS